MRERAAHVGQARGGDGACERRIEVLVGVEQRGRPAEAESRANGGARHDERDQDEPLAPGERGGPGEGGTATGRPRGGYASRRREDRVQSSGCCCCGSSSVSSAAATSGSKSSPAFPRISSSASPTGSASR